MDRDSRRAWRFRHAAVEADPDEVLVVHALGVCPQHLRQGVALFLVDGVLEVARQKACRVVRLDAYVDNLPARRLYGWLRIHRPGRAHTALRGR